MSNKPQSSVSGRRQPLLALPDPASVEQLSREQLRFLVERLFAIYPLALARLLDQPPAPRAARAGVSEMLTAAEVAQRLSTNKSWVYSHQRALGAIKLDGIVRFPQQAIETYIARRQREAEGVASR